MMNSVRVVGIVGAGTMGNGIAQACAVAGIQAVMVDISEAAVSKGLATVAGSLDRLVKKEKIGEADKAAAAKAEAAKLEADKAMDKDAEAELLLCQNNQRAGKEALTWLDPVLGSMVQQEINTIRSINRGKQ